MKVRVSAEQSGPEASDGENGQNSPRDEMLKNIEVKRRELAYQENLEKAREGAQLGSELCEAFERRKAWGAAEVKKLNRLEKLARSIRGEAGGDEDDSALKDPPVDLHGSLRMLAELSEGLRKKVEKTPKHVVSAAVIAEANQLISLIRHIKSLGS